MAHVSPLLPPAAPGAGEGADPPVAVVLAAGAGTRLAPLTRLRPKALCPVGDRPLVDHALDRVEPVSAAVAVNIHHGRSAMEAHLRADPRRPHLSVEEGEARGTAGALGLLRPWIDGRAVLVANADAHLTVDLRDFVSGWDGRRTRLLCVVDEARGDFGPLRYCGVALMPWSEVTLLGEAPSGLYEVAWGPARARGELELVTHDGPFTDCGTPADYLAANLEWSAGATVWGEGSVRGDGCEVRRSVVWPGAVVEPGEVLDRAIRAPGLTVLVR